MLENISYYWSIPRAGLFRSGQGGIEAGKIESGGSKGGPSNCVWKRRERERERTSGIVDALEHAQISWVCFGASWQRRGPWPWPQLQPTAMAMALGFDMSFSSKSKFTKPGRSTHLLQDVDFSSYPIAPAELFVLKKFFNPCVYLFPILLAD